MAENNLIITYKGSDIVDADISTETTKTLKTAGKYCEGDIIVTAQGSSGGNAQINYLYVTGYLLDGKTLDLNKTWDKGSATHGYAYTNDYLEPQNKGIHNSYAYAKITFKVSFQCDITVSMYQSSEVNYDYGFLSQLDTNLAYNYNATDTNCVNLGGSGGSQYGSKGKSGNFTYTFSNVAVGEHFITIKYRKDTSQSTGDDTFRITKIEASVVQNIKEKYYIADHSDTPTQWNVDVIETMESSSSNINLPIGTYADFNDWKNEVKTQITNKGVDSSGIPTNFPAEISQIQTGGGGTGYNVEVRLVTNGINHESYIRINGSQDTIIPDSSLFTQYMGTMTLRYVGVETIQFIGEKWGNYSECTISYSGDTYTVTSSSQIFTLTGDASAEFYVGTCLLKGTLITMADGSLKPVEEIKVGDLIMNYDGEPDEVIECDGEANKTHTEYDIWTFEGGYQVKTVHRHRFYNIEKQAMVYMDEWELGQHAYTQDGQKVALIDHKNVKETVNHYTLFTKNQNYFAGGLLSGNRYTKEIKL